MIVFSKRRLWVIHGFTVVFLSFSVSILEILWNELLDESFCTHCIPPPIGGCLTFVGFLLVDQLTPRHLASMAFHMLS